jgi:hypothetical protein
MTERNPGSTATQERTDDLPGDVANNICVRRRKSL